MSDLFQRTDWLRMCVCVNWCVCEKQKLLKCSKMHYLFNLVNFIKMTKVFPLGLKFDFPHWRQSIVKTKLNQHG